MISGTVQGSQRPRTEVRSLCTCQAIQLICLELVSPGLLAAPDATPARRGRHRPSAMFDRSFPAGVGGNRFNDRADSVYRSEASTAIDSGRTRKDDPLHAGSPLLLTFAAQGQEASHGF
jgi:hypothetical protein